MLQESRVCIHLYSGQTNGRTTRKPSHQIPKTSSVVALWSVASGNVVRKRPDPGRTRIHDYGRVWERVCTAARVGNRQSLKAWFGYAVWLLPGVEATVPSGLLPFPETNPHRTVFPDTP